MQDETRVETKRIKQRVRIEEMEIKILCSIQGLRLRDRKTTSQYRRCGKVDKREGKKHADYMDGERLAKAQKLLTNKRTAFSMNSQEMGSKLVLLNHRIQKQDKQKVIPSRLKLNTIENILFTCLSKE